MNSRGVQQYREQSLNSMTQEELLLLVLDELVKQVTRAGLALEAGNLDLFDESLDRSFYIVRYLDDTLDRRYPISRDLHRMYDFFSYDITRVKSGRKAEELERLRPMIVDLRDTFRTAAAEAAKSKGGQGANGG